MNLKDMRGKPRNAVVGVLISAAIVVFSLGTVAGAAFSAGSEAVAMGARAGLPITTQSDPINTDTALLTGENTTDLYGVQVGYFSAPANAQLFSGSLRDLGFNPLIVLDHSCAAKCYRVLLGLHDKEVTALEQAESYRNSTGKQAYLLAGL
jgi:hypothetical protein